MTQRADQGEAVVPRLTRKAVGVTSSTGRRYFELLIAFVVCYREYSLTIRSIARRQTVQK